MKKNREPASSFQTLLPKTTVRRKLPVNLKPSDNVYFQNEFEKIIPETFSLRLRNIYVLFDSIFDTRRFRFYNEFTHWSKVSLTGTLFRISLLFKKSKKINKALWVTHNWSEGYFHWLTDALPRIVACEPLFDAHPILLPESYKNHPYIDESIEMLGLPFVYYDQKTALKIEDLILPGHTAPTGNYNEGLINQIREKLSSQYSHSKPERKIYISRAKANTRKIKNEKALIGLLSDYHFEVHEFENYPFKKQIEIMSETKYLLGVHGGGLTNMLFMKKGGKIFELRNEGDEKNNCYFSLASALSLDYYYQLNKSNSRHTQTADMEIDLGMLKTNLELMTGK